jgi:hypothetical protein
VETVIGKVSAHTDTAILCADIYFRQSQYSYYDLAEPITEPIRNRLDVVCRNGGRNCMWPCVSFCKLDDLRKGNLLLSTELYIFYWTCLLDMWLLCLLHQMKLEICMKWKILVKCISFKSYLCHDMLCISRFTPEEGCRISRNSEMFLWCSLVGLAIFWSLRCICVICDIFGMPTYLSSSCQFLFFLNLVLGFMWVFRIVIMRSVYCTPSCIFLLC